MGKDNKLKFDNNKLSIESSTNIIISNHGINDYSTK